MSPLVVTLLLAAQPPMTSSVPVAGTVIDTTGAPVSHARIEVITSPGCATSTDTDGRFELPCADPQAALRVSAPGFREEEISWSSAPREGRPRIVVHPLAHSESVVVTATRSEHRTISRAAPVSVFAAADLVLAPPVPLDDVLRFAPGFGLFRRSSSRVSNPTTQGASLRGLSASGASRALVLADGVPLNDPFGGWVGWNRVPLAAIERVEVVRGGASDLYGADALAGVVQVFTLRPAAPTLRGELSGGSRRSGRASLFGGTARGGWDATLAAEAFTTDGYVLVSEDERGAVDRTAGGRHATARLGAGYTAASWHARLGANTFTEDRENGTPIQVNATDSRQVRIDVGGDVAGGQWRAAGYAADQDYRQAFSAIASDRASETLTASQKVPASEQGASVEWSRSGASLDLLVGGDLRETSATNEERGFFPDGRPRSALSTPAFQRTGGVFLQTTVRSGARLSVTAGARADLRERERSDDFADADSHVSPRVAAAWTVLPAIVMRGSVVWSYRAPTLNERYRGFRVGNIETLPNRDLQPERLRTVEGSVFVTPSRSTFRVTVFRSDLDDAATNVTVTTTPQLITRRRENIGGVRVWGSEIDAEWRPFSRATLIGSAALLDSEFVDFAPLEGLRVPQVPRWQTAVGMRLAAPYGLTLVTQVRAFGHQFDDDRNTLRLGGGAVVDLTALRSIRRSASVFVSLENLLNREYDVGRTPTRTVGQPFAAHAGVRFDLRR